MSINLQRANRATSFWKIPTPSNVGPGIYDKGNTSQFDHRRDAPAPFATTKDRVCTDKMNNNPGPG